jgi:DNA replication factor GINS
LLEVDPVHLDELRSILLSERETGRLIQVPHDLYESTREETESLSKEVYESEDPFSDRARILIERVSSIRETLQDIFRIRSAKILALAQSQEKGQFIDRDELKKMLPEEREMFDQMVLAIEQCRCLLVDGTVHRPPSKEGEVEREEPCAAILEDLSSTVPEFVLGRVLQDMEPFMGVDGRIYQLQKEDIVTLPERNADVLCERNIVLNLQEQ